MTMSTPEEILTFWLDEVGPEGWYKSNDELDAEIRDRFFDTWKKAQDGAFSLWLTYPSGCLAYLILNDQFPRNMFRGSAMAYSSDRLALAVAKIAVAKNWDMKIDEPARQFFYMPLMHSECITDQERCIRMFMTRMPTSGDSNMLHAQAHRDVIRKFGRFPFRNVALERRDTGNEAEFMKNGGYGATVEALRA
jgi:uncharacterized protein (DUF924 family)